jgi:hypothetical protein
MAVIVDYEGGPTRAPDRLVFGAVDERSFQVVPREVDANRKCALYLRMQLVLI